MFASSRRPGVIDSRSSTVIARLNTVATPIATNCEDRSMSRCGNAGMKSRTSSTKIVDTVSIRICVSRMSGER